MAKMKFKDEDAGNPNIKTWKEFGGSWQNYKKYLAENGALSPNLTVDGPDHAPVRKPPALKVPWHGKMWGHYTDEDKRNLAYHMAKLDRQRAENYRLFLVNHASAPKNLFNILNISFEGA